MGEYAPLSPAMILFGRTAEESFRVGLLVTLEWDFVWGLAQVGLGIDGESYDVFTYQEK